MVIVHCDIFQEASADELGIRGCVHSSFLIEMSKHLKAHGLVIWLVDRSHAAHLRKLLLCMGSNPTRSVAFDSWIISTVVKIC